MAFTSLSSRLGSMPQVICGPILRKTTKTEVSVWIALQSAATLTLRIYNLHTNTQIGVGAATAAKCLGAKLYVCLLRVSGLNLSPGINYGYDIDFPAGKTLASNGILAASNGMSTITFAGSAFTRPSFSLPPAVSADLGNLRLLHASCRKPHGENMDALEGVHDMMSDAITNPLSTNVQIAQTRPQQIFFTGDQIYADDVADVLLYMLRDASPSLLGWVETLPGLTPQSPSPTPGQMATGSRSTLIKDTARFSASAAASKSHLMTLGEFYCMYLFAWSPVLWPSSVLPVYDDVFPGRVQQGTVSGRAGTVPKDMDHFNLFNRERTFVTGFKNTLLKVRRLLANVPSLMILDDHEITDDWNLSADWVTEVYSSSLGKRIIANGLSAYAVFQDWGNQPLNYTPGQKGDNLLSALLYNPLNAGAPPNFNAAAALVMPVYSNSPKKLNPALNGMLWHYSVYMSSFEIVVLDIRTMRGFPEFYPFLIDPGHMPAQIQAPSGAIQFTLLISPSPIFGVPRVEQLKRAFGPGESVRRDKDGEDWGLSEDPVQYLAAQLTIRCTGVNGRVIILAGDVHYGFSMRAQYWAGNPIGPQPAGTYNLVMAQLTASSLKNEEDTFTGSYNVHRYGYRQTNGGIEPAQVVYGFEVPGPGPLSIGTQTRNTQNGSATTPFLLKKRASTITPAQYASKTGNTYSITTGALVVPEWRYRLDYFRDIFGILNRGTGPVPVTLPTSGGKLQYLNEYVQQSANYIDYAKKNGNGKEVVGTNNFGEITLDWAAIDNDRKVRHTLWWRLSANYVLPTAVLPLTQHVIPLGYTHSNHPMPPNP
jgi:hypothetical protein